MKDKFDIAFASVIGSEHVRVGMNNQDALAVATGPDFLMGVVADGCGSCPRSEVGSVLLTRWAVKHIPYILNGMKKEDAQKGLRIARSMIVNSIREFAVTSQVEYGLVSGSDVGMEDVAPMYSMDGLIATCLLSTLVGFYICNEYAILFSVGDGYQALNGSFIKLDTADEEMNAPAYLAYEAMTRIPSSVSRESLAFVATDPIPLVDVGTIMVATDGIRHIVWGQDENIPGKSSKVGGVSQLWEDKMFMNPDIMRRRLYLLSRDVHTPDWVGEAMITHPSILKDDTTVISVRRKP